MNRPQELSELMARRGDIFLYVSNIEQEVATITAQLADAQFANRVNSDSWQQRVEYLESQLAGKWISGWNEAIEAAAKTVDERRNKERIRAMKKKPAPPTGTEGEPVVFYFERPTPDSAEAE